MEGREFRNQLEQSKAGGAGSIVFIPKVLWQCAPLLSTHGGHVSCIHTCKLQKHAEEQHIPRGVERDSFEMGNLMRGNESNV